MPEPTAPSCGTMCFSETFEANWAKGTHSRALSSSCPFNISTVASKTCLSASGSGGGCKTSGGAFDADLCSLVADGSGRRGCRVREPKDATRLARLLAPGTLSEVCEAFCRAPVGREGMGERLRAPLVLGPCEISDKSLSSSGVGDDSRKVEREKREAMGRSGEGEADSCGEGEDIVGDKLRLGEVCADGEFERSG